VFAGASVCASAIDVANHEAASPANTCLRFFAYSESLSLSALLRCIPREYQSGSRSAFAHGLNQRFHVIQIALECFAPGIRKTIFRPRHAAFEGLGALHIFGFF